MIRVRRHEGFKALGYERFKGLLIRYLGRGCSAYVTNFLYVRCVFILADGLSSNDANGLLEHSNFDCTHQ
jgi:hypothetical protein